MVTIANINRELEKYLNSRRSREGARFFKRPKPKKDPEPLPQDLKSDEVHVFDQEESFWDRLLNRKREVVSEDLTPDEMARLRAMEAELEQVETVEEAHPELEAELEPLHESLFDQFLNLFRGFRRRHWVDEQAEKVQFIEEEVVPQLDEDVKRVLKIIHKWIAKLPKRYKDEFKKSKDFILYRDLLEKYGVAKKKDRSPKGEPKEAPKLDGDYPVLKAKK